MFIASALNPSYFKEKINLFIALAPCPTNANTGPPGWIANHIKLIEFVVVDILQYYNWFAPMPRAVAIVDTVCGILPSVCLAVKGKLHLLNHDVDNMERFGVFLSNEPSGQSYRTFVY